jgi:hypothetical protein
MKTLARERQRAREAELINLIRTPAFFKLSK